MSIQCATGFSILSPFCARTAAEPFRLTTLFGSLRFYVADFYEPTTKLIFINEEQICGDASSGGMDG